MLRTACEYKCGEFWTSFAVALSAWKNDSRNDHWESPYTQFSRHFGRVILGYIETDFSEWTLSGKRFMSSKHCTQIFRSLMGILCLKSLKFEENISTVHLTTHISEFYNKLAKETVARSTTRNREPTWSRLRKKQNKKTAKTRIERAKAKKTKTRKSSRIRMDGWSGLKCAFTIRPVGRHTCPRKCDAMRVAGKLRTRKDLRNRIQWHDGETKMETTLLKERRKVERSCSMLIPHKNLFESPDQRSILKFSNIEQRANQRA